MYMDLNSEPKKKKKKEIYKIVVLKTYLRYRRTESYICKVE